jgi:hypothetical protein
MGDQYKGFQMSAFKRHVIVSRDFNLDRLVLQVQTICLKNAIFCNLIFCRKRGRPLRLENTPMYIAKQRT